MFFCRLPVFVEGIEDVAFLATYLQLTGRWRDFRKHGCHFVVAEGKRNLSRPLAIARGLDLPTFVVFDGDGNNSSERVAHERDNACILRLCDHGSTPAWPDTTFFGDNLVMWATTIGQEVMSDFGTDTWDEVEKCVRSEHGLTIGIRRKNSTLIAGTVEALWNQGFRSEMLEKACSQLISYSARI